jgi:DNA-binding LytR/AlgR family response regulator
MPGLGDLLSKLSAPGGKTSFLVFRNQQYKTISIEDIAFFYVRHDATWIMCFDKQEFVINQSLDQVTNAVSPRQFFRLNRQYLVNFKAIKAVEPYFLRKLYVKLHIETKEKLLVNKEKSHGFLTWMEDR